jgi:hypothetical protein
MSQTKAEILSSLLSLNHPAVEHLASSTSLRKYDKETLQTFLEETSRLADFLSELDQDGVVELFGLREVETPDPHCELEVFVSEDGDEVAWETLPPAELPGFRTTESHDPDCEYFAGYDVGEWGESIPVWDDRTSAADPYWTTSGNIPAIHNATHQFEEKNPFRNFHEQAPDKQFYSAAKTRELKAQHRNFITIMSWIRRSESNLPLLRSGWKHFWRKYFAKKNTGEISSWLLGRHVSSIRAAFSEVGITSRGGEK